MMGVDADMVAGLRLQTCELIDLGLVCAQSGSSALKISGHMFLKTLNRISTNLFFVST